MAFQTNLVARGETALPGLLATHFAMKLNWWAADYPGMSLTAGIGWKLCDEDAEPWTAAGLGETGWLYAAAGLSVDEALGILASSVPTPEAELRMLAALRGVALLG